MRHLILAAWIAAIGANAHAGEADLIGTYAAQEKTGMREVIRIERDASGYVLFDKAQNGTWRKSNEPLVPVTKEQLSKMMRAPVDVPFDGLGNKGFALFKVPKGWGQGKFKTESGYFMVFALGPIELQKQ